MAGESTAELPAVAVGGEEVDVAALQTSSPKSSGRAAGLSNSPSSQQQTPSPANSSTEVKGGVARTSREQKELGVDRCVERCWEYQKVVVTAESLEEIRVISAWFGHPENQTQRVDITADVSVIFGENGFAVGALAAGVPRAESIELQASVRKWGDPASLCLKQLEVTYDRLWLTAEERIVVKSLQRRAQVRALDAPDLEDLLDRLATALLSVAATSATAPACATDATDPSTACADDGAADAVCTASSVGPPPIARISPRWKRLGFQACNPRTDLRTGCLALEALVYLVEHYPLAATQMATEAQRDDVDYPFAVASINVTQLLARYLGLVSDGASSSSGFNCVAPRRVLRVFAQLMISTGSDHDGAKSGMPQVDVFGELHAAAMARLHTTWRALKILDPQLTVMNFQRALDATMTTVHAFCTQRVLECPLDFRGLSVFDFGESDLDALPESSVDAPSGMLLSGAELLVSGATRLLASGADGLSGTAGLFASSASAAGGGLQAAINGGASRLSETAGQVGALFRVWQTEKEDESGFDSGELL